VWTAVRVVLDAGFGPASGRAQCPQRSLSVKRPVFFNAEVTPGDPWYYASISTTIEGLGMEVPGEGPSDKSP